MADEPTDKIVLTKITPEMTDEEIEKMVDGVLDEVLGPDEDPPKKDEAK